MRLEFIPKTKAKIAAVVPMAQKLGQTELRPAVSLSIKMPLANPVLDQLDRTLRTFLYNKNPSAKQQAVLDGIPAVAELTELTEAAKAIGAIDWAGEMTGAKLKIYHGATGHGDISLKDGTVDKVKVVPKEGGTVDLSYNYYCSDLDADTLGALAVLHQHEVEIEMEGPEVIGEQQRSLDEKPARRRGGSANDQTGGGQADDGEQQEGGADIDPKKMRTPPTGTVVTTKQRRRLARTPEEALVHGESIE